MLREIFSGRYEGYWIVIFFIKVNGVKVEVIVWDDYGNEIRKIVNGKFYINIEN